VVLVQDIFWETVLSNLNNCLEQSRTELDLVILANIQAFTRIEHIGDKISPHCHFQYQSVPICKDMLLHLYGLSYSRFCQLKEPYESHDISQTIHRNCKRIPSNTLPQTVVEDVEFFLSNYIEENAISLPGQILGYRIDDIELLSSSKTKMSVWCDFNAAVQKNPGWMCTGLPL